MNEIKEAARAPRRSMLDKTRRMIERDMYASTKELCQMHEHGIDGIKPYVRNPELDSYNEDVDEEYLDDFPSFYQIRGVQFLLDEKRILIADEMGVGKTAQAVAGKLELENRYGGKFKTLVITQPDIKDHWQEKIDEYTEREQNAVKLDDYDEESLEAMKDADFVIVNYPAFGSKPLRDVLGERMLKEGFRYVVLDEVHNVRNHAAARTDYIRRIAAQAEYMCALSGTPIPDSLDDTFMLITLLESDVYKDVVDKKTGRVLKTAPQVVREAFWKRPYLIKAILGRKRLKREMKDIAELPKIHIHPEGIRGYIELSPEQNEIYQAIYENDELEGAYKLLQLRKALTDPSLVDRSILTEELRGKLDSIDSVKYKELDGIVEKYVSEGRKVVVYSPLLKSGVMEKLQKRYENYNFLRVDGDITGKRRSSIVREFQRDPLKMGLISTDITSEGIPLTAGSVMVLLDEPYVPGRKSQMIKRLHRRGQKNDVDVISLAVRDTIDDGMLELLHLKQEGIDFIEKGERLRPEHVDALGSRPESSMPLSHRLYTPQQKIRIYSSRMVGKGSKRIRRALMRNDYAIARKYAENYPKDWELSYSAKVSRVVKQIVEGLSEREELGKKVDIGSSFGVLSKTLGEKTTNIDLNEHSFSQIYADSNNNNVAASLSELPLKDGGFDMAVCSLALYYTSLEGIGSDGGKRTEREEALREANRILRNGGYYLVTLPRTVISPEQEPNFLGSLRKTGFEVIPELTGTVKAQGNDDFQTYVALARKTGPPLADILDSNSLFLEVDERRAGRGRKSYSGKKGAFDNFSFLSEDGEIPVESRARSYIERLFREDI